jgi:hypothetical protein
VSLAELALVGDARNVMRASHGSMRFIIVALLFLQTHNERMNGPIFGKTSRDYCNEHVC